MAYLGFSVPKSLLDCAGKVGTLFSYGDNFVVLSGNQGSGRTTVLEHVINSLDNRFTTVFIPCSREMELEKLRTLFLQQLCSQDKWDASESIENSIKKASVPVREKVLIVIDDIDLVVSSFADEIFSLYKHSLGTRRFSFLITAHPLWLETKGYKNTDKNLSIEEVCVPFIGVDEALELCKKRFEFSQLNNVYEAILPKLPKAFQSCDGNIGKIIKLTEKLMSDPTQVEKEQKEVAVEKKVATGSKKNLTAIFISLLCLAIVVACLLPVILGSKDSVGKKPEPVKVEDVKDSSNQTSNVTDDPLAVSAGSVSSIKADSLKGDGKTAVDDNGELLDKIEGGVETQGLEKTTKNEVTLQGETLDAIENSSGEKVDDPRQGLGGSKVNSQSAYLTRANNALYKDQIEHEDALIKKQEQEALADKKALEALKKKQSENAAKDNKLADNNQVAKDNNKVQGSASKQAMTAKKTEKVQKKQTKVIKEKSVAGSEEDLLKKNPRHYTLQIFASYSKAPLLDVADTISGKYYIYQTRRNGKLWFVLITGDYLTARDGLKTVSSLPEKVKKAGPFIKTFGKVQQEMKLK